MMIIGLESKFRQVMSWIDETDVGAIGIYGTGGVGKTTLLQMIKKELLMTRHHDVQVVWLHVSRQQNLRKIQEDVYRQVVMPHRLWSNRYDNNRAREAKRLLTGKKFVLLLDDLWDRLDLSTLGIPPEFRENGSKVVFTTRSEEVCSSMGASRRMKLDCLAAEEALQLFQAYAGEPTGYSHPEETQRLSMLFTQECKGLPLALITVGQSMATKRSTDLWQSSLQVLKAAPLKFPGMEDQVIRVLKFSYDSLNDDALRSCFLYCSIFPKDHIIRKDELIELWIREGLLGEVDDILDAREVGERFVRKLKDSSLLETGGGACGNDIHVGENHVRMHPLIREMALWIDSKYGERSGRTLVLDDHVMGQGHMFQEADKVERLTLWGRGRSYKELPVLAFPNLKTLLVRCTNLDRFPAGFFHHMHEMTILDLSGNHKLIYVPHGVGELINLFHLNLSETGITSLPKEVRNLKKLKSLLLDETYYLTHIPRKLISGLQLLEVFSKVQYKRNIHFDEGALLEELELLRDLVEAGVMITSRNSLDKFLSSNNLVCCTRRLSFNDIAELSSLEIPDELLKKMNDLETLEIFRCVFNWMVFSPMRGTTPGSCPTIQPISLGNFPGLRTLKLWDCPGKLDFRWIIYLPNLQLLSLAGCELVYEIVPDERIRSMVNGDTRNIFPNLTTLILNDMANLSSISLQPLSFPLLKELYVYLCPKLKQLPSDSEGASSLDEIRGTQTWWNELHWEDEDVRLALSAKFHPIDATNNVIFREGSVTVYRSFDNSTKSSPITHSASPIPDPSHYQVDHTSSTSSQNSSYSPIYLFGVAIDVASTSNQQIPEQRHYEQVLPNESTGTPVHVEKETITGLAKDHSDDNISLSSQKPSFEKTHTALYLHENRPACQQQEPASVTPSSPSNIVATSIASEDSTPVALVHCDIGCAGRNSEGNNNDENQSVRSNYPSGGRWSRSSSGGRNRSGCHYSKSNSRNNGSYADSPLSCSATTSPPAYRPGLARPAPTAYNHGGMVLQCQLCQGYDHSARECPSFLRVNSIGNPVLPAFSAMSLLHENSPRDGAWLSADDRFASSDALSWSS